MKRQFRLAFNALKKIGVPVYVRDDMDGRFGSSAEHPESYKWADYYADNRKDSEFGVNPARRQGPQKVRPVQRMDKPRRTGRVRALIFTTQEISQWLIPLPFKPTSSRSLTSQFEVSKASGDPTASEEFSRAMLSKYFLGRIEERDLPPLAQGLSQRAQPRGCGVNQQEILKLPSNRAS